MYHGVLFGPHQDDTRSSSSIGGSDLSSGLAVPECLRSYVTEPMRISDCYRATLSQGAILGRISARRGWHSGVLSERQSSRTGNNRTIRFRITLEAAGVMFLGENGEGPGVRLRKS